MRDLDLTTLRLFVSVCETGNIARAGERANMVGSAISKRLAQLEDTVGTPLLLRKRRGVVPTPALAHLSSVDGCPAAMITASHNPFHDNGVKFFSARGEKTSANAPTVSSIGTFGSTRCW